MNGNVCPKCGAAVAPGTAFCAGCGTPIATGTVAQVQPVQQQVSPVQVQQPMVTQVSTGTGSLLVRRKSSFFGCAVPLAVTVDGNNYTFHNGNELSLNLAPGVHVVTWKFWCRKLKETQVTVSPGGTYLVELVYDWLWGGFKLGKDSKIA